MFSELLGSRGLILLFLLLRKPDRTLHFKSDRCPWLLLECSALFLC